MRGTRPFDWNIFCETLKDTQFAETFAAVQIVSALKNTPLIEGGDITGPHDSFAEAESRTSLLWLWFSL